jgi:Spy/CpxP family protein refolding chaperone
MVSPPIFRTAALLLAVLPLALHAQTPSRGAGGGPGLEALRQNPVQRVLDARADLGLTDAQVARLEPIRARLEARNRSYLARLDSLRQTMPDPNIANRDAVQASMEQIRPIRQEIQENNRRALDEIRPHLTPSQREKVDDLVRPRGRP